MNKRQRKKAKKLAELQAHNRRNAEVRTWAEELWKHHRQCTLDIYKLWQETNTLLTREMVERRVGRELMRISSFGIPNRSNRNMDVFVDMEAQPFLPRPMIVVDSMCGRADTELRVISPTARLNVNKPRSLLDSFQSMPHVELQKPELPPVNVVDFDFAELEQRLFEQIGRAMGIPEGLLERKSEKSNTTNGWRDSVTGTASPSHDAGRSSTSRVRRYSVCRTRPEPGLSNRPAALRLWTNCGGNGIAPSHRPHMLSMIRSDQPCTTPSW